MAKFEVVSDYSPSGDQPKAIEALSLSIEANNQYNTLLGVTGSGKTYTIAKVIERVQKPTLIMTHNKTLAAQLYSEFKQFFPNNHVEYFISYYDYYQPEAYIPRSDLFIEKDSSINDELERLRLSATASLLSFDDVIVIASVSANYGLGNPSEYKAMVQRVEVGFSYSQKEFLLKLIEMGYKRNDKFFDRADFRVNGDVIDIFPAYYEDEFLRVEFFGDEVESITLHEYLTNTKIKDLKEVIIYSVNPFVVTQENLANAVKQIEEELEERLDFFQKEQKLVEYQRLKQRVEFDLEMIEATGMCKGIENYARHLTGLKPGETPYSLLDYFAQMDKDFLLVVDESHVSLPQFRGMHAADRSRKEVLVEYGFRLPSALDNRPLKFDEFINKAPNYIFVSATPNELELELSSVVAEQIIRPTGLLDPVIEIVDSEFQVEKLHDEIKKVTSKNQRVLVTVLTKKMAEELASYYADLGIKVKYMHSEIDAIERNQIIRELRIGTFDVLIGINLLREGLDIPETSLVAILDADKEGFLRSRTSLIQTIGRAARNEEGRVILFAKKITDSMQFAIDETNRRRKIQEEHNIKNNITPKSTKRKLDENLKLEEYDSVALKKQRLEKMPASERKKLLVELNKQMKKASSELNFEEAIRLRDEIAKIKDL
ncbi:excinuclease ABC subunit UvrB [Aliarcobacter skirrowii]|uniref:UvrABC system protein B n=2 Tax=Aliarcobacter skirrowii TaxID=28200 RepID=A0AAD0WNR2_9BACT|nr:excinuclease ABC subunit UvrB [Aliarcobacter skirrowii]AXX85183.1 UvrABC nucleotide excision repair complex, subunit UvrB [Aliarcobacter skirrowii CCUG 10374]KAB0620662.1 excinuclease ABC subunit UvrB [Aliarcobacter skirrowii CCUG 10374]MDX4069328.1 excinuclease ABC subunit UvrB [Aliarcobacter skirrowii]RXI25990.1 excinuclease ABC subunit UvrB [Aliarcobacter skirrowii CCUG 10374]SUU96288.1 excinuclease ABC subunit B [Aliarcobacter skirrowii]